jgi:hypothetical protein
MGADPLEWNPAVTGNTARIKGKGLATTGLGALSAEVALRPRPFA